MKKQKTQILNVMLFNLLRTICTKSFIVLFILLTSAFLIWNIGCAIWILKTAEQTSITASIIVSVIFGIFFLGIFNIVFLTKTIIQDSTNGINNLELRNGVKVWEMYWSRILACKIITCSFIVFLVLLHLIIYGSTPLVQKQFILTAITPGLCSLFAFDLIFTGLILLFATWSQLYLTLGITFSLFTLYLIFPILGLLPLMFYNSNNIETKYANEYYYADKALKFSKKYNNRLTFKLLSDMHLFQDNFLSCTVNCSGKEKWSIVTAVASEVGSYATINNGLILDIDNIINKYNSENNLESRFAITTGFENSFIYKFINTLNNSYNGEKTDVSWFKDNKNYRIKYQLNEVFKKTKALKIDPSIDTNEIQSLNELVYSFFANEMFVNYKNYGYTSNSVWNGIFLDYSSASFDEEFKSANSIMKSSVRLYTKILLEILHNGLYVWKDSITKINNFWTKYDDNLKKAKLIYLANPFMTFYEMVVFSGTNNTFVENNLIAFNSFIPLTVLQKAQILTKSTKIKLTDDNGYYFPRLEDANFVGINVDNKRLFHISWIYICYLALAITLIIGCGFIYKKRLYS